MYDAFLSYAHSDSDLAAVISGALESRGFSVYWDRHLEPGSRWSDELERAITTARAVVVLWTPASAASSWVKAEATRGLETGKLVPIAVPGTTIPMPFSQVQTIALNYTSLSESDPALHALIESLAKLRFRSQQSENVTLPLADPARPRGTFQWRRALFSFEDRLSRRHFWLSLLMLFATSLAIEAGLTAALLGARSEADSLADVHLYRTMLLLYPLAAVCVKRLHDIGRSGWWALFVAPVEFLDFIGGFIADTRLAGQFELGAPLMVVAVVPYILVGSLPGDSARNRYGYPM